MALKYNIDPAHSRLGFVAKHMMVSKVRGHFTDFTGSVELPDDKDLTKATVAVTINTASVVTSDDKRDGHLRSADFFDADEHPQMTFISTSIRRAGDNTYKVVGDLSIKGQTHPVELEAEVEDAIQDPWGNERTAISATGKIDRKLWGLTWNQVLEAGRLLVSDQITLDIDAAFVRKLEPAAVQS